MQDSLRFVIRKITGRGKGLPTCGPRGAPQSAVARAVCRRLRFRLRFLRVPLREEAHRLHQVSIGSLATKNKAACAASQGGMRAAREQLVQAATHQLFFRNRSQGSDLKGKHC